MGDVQYWPIDVDELQKGTYLSVDQVEEITGERAGTNEYRLKLLQIKRYIEELSAMRGTPLLLKGEADGLRVMTDIEALRYKGHQHDLGKRMLQRICRQVHYVDPVGLTAAQQVLRDREILRQSRMVQAMLAEDRAYKRLSNAEAKALYAADPENGEEE